MKCPVCKQHKTHSDIAVHANGFDEQLFHCDLCGSTWSVNHGLVDIVRDTQRRNFLGAGGEAVEGADYS